MSAEPGSRIDPGARIHPTAIVEGDVHVGAGTEIGAFCYVVGPVIIGENNRIFPRVIIGTEAEHGSLPSSGVITIGDNNTIRENTVIHRGTGDRDTRLGSGCYLMDGVHISHDCIVHDSVTMAHKVVLAGHVVVLEGANLGMMVNLHQHSVVGAYVMAGQGAVIVEDPVPFSLVVGNPARLERMNTHALDKQGFGDDAVALGHDEDGRVTSITYHGEVMKEHVDRYLGFQRRKPLVEISVEMP